MKPNASNPHTLPPIELQGRGESELPSVDSVSDSRDRMDIGGGGNDYSVDAIDRLPMQSKPVDAQTSGWNG